MNIGQINFQNHCGRLLYSFILEYSLKNIFEIGTWNGLGSTTCVAKALKEKNSDTDFRSIELYPEMYQQALINLKHYSKIVSLYCGSIVKPNELNWFDDTEIDLENDEHAKRYYKSDLENLNQSQDLNHIVPSEIDLLILDGGEYTTYPEYQKLRAKTRFIFLDDINTFKCSKICKEVLSSEYWEIIFYNNYERNGFLLCENLNHDQKYNT